MASASVTFPAASLTVSNIPLLGYRAITFNSSAIYPPSNYSLGSNLSASGNEIYVNYWFLRGVERPEMDLTTSLTPDTQKAVRADFTTAVETGGTITYTLVSTGVSFSFSMSDFPNPPDSNDPYSWRVPQSVNLLTTDFVNAVIAASPADRSIRITVNDNLNFAPNVTAVGTPLTLNAGESVTLTGTATDPDVVPDTLTYAWTAAPNLGSFSDSAALSPTWTAPTTPTDADRQIVLKLTATEPDENLTGSASVTVTIRGNQAPTVTASATPTPVDSGGSVTLTGTAADPESQAMTYMWTSDSGGSFSNSTALSPTWTAPTVTASTVVSLTLTASDGARTGSASVDVIVRPPQSLPLTLASIPAKTAATGAVVNVSMPSATQGLAPYIYSVSGLPTGLGFVSGRVKGIPVLPGVYSVTYMVTDSNQDAVTRTFNWTITGSIIPQPVGRNVRIDWGNQFFASAKADVTDRIVSDLVCERGKNTASAVLARSQAGRLSFQLQNSDGLYDQENSDSELAGLIYPGVRVEVRDGITPIWTGVLDSIPTAYALDGQHRASVTAYGVLSLAREGEVGGGSLTAESTYQAFNELCGKVGIPVEPAPSGATPYIMARWWERGALREALRVLEDTEGGLIYESKTGALGFQDGGYRSRQAKSVTFVSETPGSNELRIVGNPKRQLAVKDVHNEIIAELRTFMQSTGQTLVQFEDAIPIGLGGRLDLATQYPIDKDGVSSLDALVAGTDWNANTAADGSGTDVTSQVSVTASLNDFNEVDVVISYAIDTGLIQASTVYVRGLTITGTLLAAATPLRATPPILDQTSIDRYRLHSLTLSDTWLRSMTDLRARALAILAILAEPERRISLDWHISDWQDFHALELSDKVRVELPTVESDGYIEAIRLLIPLSQINPVCTLDISLVD